MKLCVKCKYSLFNTAAYRCIHPSNVNFVDIVTGQEYYKQATALDNRLANHTGCGIIAKYWESRSEITASPLTTIPQSKMTTALDKLKAKAKAITLDDI